MHGEKLHENRAKSKIRLIFFHGSGHNFLKTNYDAGSDKIITADPDLTF